MKKKISLILAFVFLFVAALPITQIPISVSAATAEDADFKMTAPDGTVTYHNASEFTGSSSTNPTYKYCSGTGTTTLEMLRNVTHGANFWIFGNVVLNGGNDKNSFVYTYTGTDYAFCTASNSSTGLGHAKPADSELRTAKIINLTLVGKHDTSTGVSGIAGCLKFYNSILHLGEGNNFTSENLILLTPTEHGKFIISGGTYTTSTDKNLFEIGGDRTSNGKTYYSTVNAEIRGGTFTSIGDTVSIRFNGSSKNSTSITISGGVFHTARYNTVKIENGTLNVTGGEFYGDIVGKANTTINVSTKLPQGIIAKGDGKINVSSSSNIKNPIVAELYIENSTTPYMRLTRSDLVYYFAQASDTNVFGYDKNVFGKNSRVEFIDNVYTYRAQLNIQANKGKTVTVNGNGKTIFGHTSMNPILRAHGYNNGGKVIFNQLHLNNEGASCFQFYNSITVDVNACHWYAPNHRPIYPTNAGTVNLNDGTVIRGGQSAIYFDIQYDTLSAVINVNSGASVIALNDQAIVFSAGSNGGTVNVYEGAQVRTKKSTSYLSYISEDRIAKNDDGSNQVDSNGNPIYLYAHDNHINVLGGTVEGLIQADASQRGTNTVNLQSGTIYTTQTKEQVRALTGATVTDPFVFVTPTLSYIISIPELISFSPEKSDNISIMADLWNFTENSQIYVQVESKNGFKLNYTGSGNVNPYKYTLMSSQMGVVREDCVAAVFRNGDDGKKVTVEASIDPGQAPSVFAGEYTDTLTFTVNYTNTEEELFELPKTSVKDIKWHSGFVGSDTHNQHWIVVGVDAYRYSDVFIVPEAGTTIRFIDYYGPVTNGAVNGNAKESITPNSVFIFTASKFMYHNITQGSVYEWGYTPDYTYTGNPTKDIGFSRRGNDSNCSADKAETGTKTIDGVTYDYVVWSYTTQRNHEAIRLCLRSESDVKSEEDMNGPTITVILPQ